MVRWSCAVGLLLLAAGGVGLAAEVDITAAAQGVVARHSAAIVPIKVVRSTKATMPGREIPEQETESEILGTVLDADGVIVTSNAAADPASHQPERPGMKIESEVKSTKLVQKDGTEVALKIVLRDKELDLMFLRPEKKLDLPHLELKEKGPELGLAEEVILVWRLGAVGDRQPSVTIGRVNAVVNKPRRFYVTNLVGDIGTLGCPVFNSKGELAGISTLRIVKSAAVGRQGASLIAVVLPVADIIQDMKQIEKAE